MDVCDETHVCIRQTPLWALISPFLLSSVIIFSRIEVLQETLVFGMFVKHLVYLVPYFAVV